MGGYLLSGVFYFLGVGALIASGASFWWAFAAFVLIAVGSKFESSAAGQRP